MGGRSVLVSTLVLLIPAATVTFGEEYDARVIEVGNGTHAQTIVPTPPAVVSFESNFWPNGYGTRSESTVGRGIITEANLRVVHSDSRTAQYWRLTSRMEFTDVVFTSPTNDPISVSLNLYFDGVFDFTEDTDLGGQNGSDVRAAIAMVFVNNVDMGYFRPDDSDEDGTEHGAIGGDGLFAGHSGNAINGVFTTPTFTVLPNQPQTIDIRIQFDGWAGESNAPGVWRRTRAQFDTISLPPNGPVFDLPPGVDVDSVEADIVDNIWGGVSVAGPGAVPDGNQVPGVPLRVEKDPEGGYMLTWSAGCSVNGTDYQVYRGTIGSWYDHAPHQCSTAGATSVLVPMTPEDVYYLVVPTDGIEEGSHGRDSSGAERPFGLSTCVVQALDVSCP